MKRLGVSILLILLLSLAGCQGLGEKTASISVIYGAAAVLSLVLLALCCVSVKKSEPWLTVLFSSVLVVNIGYTVLSLSGSLTAALIANALSYLGSVLLPLAMLMIILRVTRAAYKKWLPYVLLGVAFVMFLITASPGILPIYYKEVSFAVVNGVSALIKVYGPLHHLYLFYLLGYFIAMVAVIIGAQRKKTVANTALAVIMAVAALVNIFVWLAEQFVSLGFEVLSVSYIISEAFLLGVHFMAQAPKPVRSVETDYPQGSPCRDIKQRPLDGVMFAPERIDDFIAGLGLLTPTERAVFDAYVGRATTKEVMASLGIKESTLKFHNRNLYGKLGVSNRKELLELDKHARQRASEQELDP